MKTVFINLLDIKSSEEFHCLLKKELKFPDYYGMNWDAFWDSITGLVEMPDKIENRGWLHLRKMLPVDSENFLSCLHEYNDQPDLKKIEVFLK